MVADGERWWGGAVVDGYRMPFKAGYTRDLVDLGGNQGSSLLVSNRGRYAWSDSPFTVHVSDATLRLAPHRNAVVELGDTGGSLRDAFLAAASAHFPADGALPARPLFAAPQYNLWIEMLFEPTQERVLRYAEDIVVHGFPPGVLMIDDMWHESHYGNWTFHSGRFPDPRGMVDELHARGFAVMVWVVPYVSADTPAYRDAAQAGALLTGDDGEPLLGKWWNGYSAAVDLRTPAGIEWLRARLDRLIEVSGVDGFKFDGGEALFYADLRLDRPEDFPRAWNDFGARYPYNEFRDAWNFGGRGLAQRQRDKFHSWDDVNGLGSLIPNALAQGLTGYAFTTPDMIGGGDYNAFPQPGGAPGSFDAELFVRFAQIAALCPMMQFSAAPWRVLDDEHAAICAAAAQLHVAFADEICRLAEAAAVTGEPIQRALSYVFPHLGYDDVRDQFLVGDEVLVAPVVVKGARERTVVIPPGTWRADDGCVYKGPTEATIDAPLARLPWFRRISD